MSLNDDIIKIISTLADEERTEVIDKNHAYYVEKRRQALKEQGLEEKEIIKQQERDRETLKTAGRKKEREEIKKNLQSAAEYEADAKTRNLAKQKLEMMRMADEFSAAIGNALSGGIQAVGNLYGNITQQAKFYGDLIGQMETRLLGSGKTYASVSDMISKVFAAGPFFSMESTMKKTSEFVEKGIAFNVELRSSMAVLSDKVARTFDAFDSTLLRLIKIQQQDSTAARLSMENMLTKFLNNQYQNTEYLNQLSKSVSAALIETSYLQDRETKTEFDYSVQSWLGSMSSAGVSDSTIQKLAEGMGYLGSGNISAISSNTALEQLLVASANRSSGRTYGDILTTGATSEDVGSLFTGLHNLVSDITSSGNLVAINQYAQIFGLSMSDLRSVLNLTSKDIQVITANTKSYQQALSNLQTETSREALLSRSSTQEIIENYIGNLVGDAGRRVASSTGSYLAWKMAGMVSDFLDGITTNIGFLGSGVSLKIGDITRAASVLGALSPGLVALASNLGSPQGVNLSALENAEVVTRGGGNFIREGSYQSESTFVGDVSSSALYSSANVATEQTAAMVTDASVDEEKERADKMKATIDSIDDNVAFIVQMMNTTGIVIRGRTGETQADTFFDSLAGGINR